MILTIDYETYYSSEFSLSRMSEVDYILDPRFEFICCAFKEGVGNTFCVWGEDEIRRVFAGYDFSKIAMMSHNMRFDGAIAAWKLGVKPALYLDTLGMARATTHAFVGRSSLAKVSDYLGLPPKGDEVVNAIGMRAASFTPAQRQAYMDYCVRDTDNCHAIYTRLMRTFPKGELAVIDWNARMFIEPQVALNRDKLAAHLLKAEAEREQGFNMVAHIDRAVFSSQKKFTALLEQYGVEIPMKISPATGDEIPALAKNDVGFKELQEDPNLPKEVQALLAARVNSKSTIETTRTAKLINLARHDWNGTPALMPVPLNYYGAHTGRFSGGGGFNFQNLQRMSELRNAIEAPDGCVVLYRDASQIEARMTAWLAGCEKLLTAFANGADIYSQFATSVYGYLVTKALKKERFVGKTSILGLGYGMGPERFKRTLYIGAGGFSLDITLEEAERIVALYRSEYKEIQKLWWAAKEMIDRMIGMCAPADGRFKMRNLPDRGFRPIPAIAITQDAIWLPNGMCIAYPDIRDNVIPTGNGDTRHVISYKSPTTERKFLFGGKVVENLSQALSRVILTDLVRRVKHETNKLPFLTTHDSLCYVVPHGQAQEWDAYLDRQFAVRPTWAPDLPLASEGGWGFTMGAAERGENP